MSLCCCRRFGAQPVSLRGHSPADTGGPPSAFGVRVVKPTPLLKASGPLFDHKDAAVRDTAKALAVELTRWLGAAAVKRDLTDKMRDAQKKGVSPMVAEPAMAG